MASFEAVLTNELHAKFLEAKKLEEEDSKNDPENDPYRSRYKAREILHEIMTIAKSHENENSKEEGWLFVLAATHLKLGINYNDTEETGSGEEHLTKSVELLEDLKTDKRSVNILQSALNQIGVMWASRRNFEKAQEYLERSEKLYLTFKHEVGNAPMFVDEFFIPSEVDSVEANEHKRGEKFEQTYTYTMYYLAQVYGKLNESGKSARYCHITLQRQLDTMNYEPLDWALNAATLSQYYITSSNFTMARHCLASASVIIQEVSEEGDENVPQEDIDNKNEKLLQAKADIDRCWAKYGLALLETSRDKLIEENIPITDHNDDKKLQACGSTQTDGDTNADDCQADQNNMGKENTLFNLEVTSNEGQVTDSFLKELTDAREVFLFVQKRLNSSKNFYVVDGHCSDYIEIIQDHSTAYKLLAFYDTDLQRQCQMHKRRIDMVQDVVSGLNKQFYLLVFRQLTYELAETYSQMLDLKLAISEETGQPSTHSVQKINQLASKSIEHYNEYLKSLENQEGKLPEKFAEDDERPALVAHFCVGRLHSKFLVVEISDRISNIKRSLDYYTYLVEYCKRNPSVRSKVLSEVEICEEMTILLPVKMDKIRAGVLA